MARKFILDEAGEAIECDDLMRWANWFETSDAERLVERTPVGERVVLTYFLALDYNFFGEDAPLLWQTTVVGDDYQERYTSVEDARAGHAALVARLRAALP